MELRIFNRWGEKLFSSKNIANGWDGFYNGKLCEQGTYIYQFEYTPYKGKGETLTGHINIIRSN